MAAGGGANPPSFRVSGREFPLAKREIEISGTRVSLLEVPYTQAHLDALTHSDPGGPGHPAAPGPRERDWPYWLEDWPATYALAEALAALDAPPLLPPVLDLGCGSGFLGAFLRERFGLPAVSADFNPDACRLAALNAGPRTVCADMARFPSRKRFGLVLCGEMLYARENHAPILAFLGVHLAPGGSAWLADPGRSAASGFALAAGAAGFRARVLSGRSRAAGRNVDVYILDRPGKAL